MLRYFYLLLIILCFTGCGKLFIENRYTKKLIGDWRITEVKLRSGQTIYSAYNFKNEKFSFKDDNLQGLVNPANKTYEGKWYVSSNTVQQDCYTAPAGNTVCSDVTEVNLNALTWIPPHAGNKDHQF
jgi:hypothetical protein